MNADLNVEFGQLSIGETMARLGIKIDRKKMSLKNADQLFAGSILNCVLTAAAPDNGDGGQEDLPGMPELPTLETIAEVKCFGANRKNFTAGLTINVSALNASDLAQFAQQKGRLQVERIGDIPEKKRGRKKANPAPDGAPDDEGSTG